MINPKISIITINFNNKVGLQNTIESVIHQTYNDFEFIVIDGGSTDGSRQILEQFSDHLTSWLSEPDTGIYNAMNKGIARATGQYILFLNSGDVFLNQDVLGMAESKIDGIKDLYYGNIHLCVKDQVKEIVYPTKLTFDFFYHNNLPHQATFIRRTLFADVFMYNENMKIASDWEFFIYTICKANALYSHLEFFITGYDGTGISSNKNNQSLIAEERKLTIKKFFPAFEDDYEVISQFREKRVKQFFKIKKYPRTWRLLKGLMSFLLLFLPKDHE
jgi:glycosyltransferase involved in cell wall biosynthesis